MRAGRVCAVGLVLVAAAGCSSSSTAAHAAGPSARNHNIKNPCRYLPAADAARILKLPQVSTPAPGYSCGYMPAYGAEPRPPELTLQLLPAKVPPSFKHKVPGVRFRRVPIHVKGREAMAWTVASPRPTSNTSAPPGSTTWDSPSILFWTPGYSGWIQVNATANNVAAGIETARVIIANLPKQ